MVKENPVSLNIQTIFCLIPVLDMYAAYRVKKLRKYLLIMILAVAIPVAIVDYMLFPVNNPDVAASFYELFIFYYGIDDNRFVFSVLVQIGTILFAIYLIRHWSKQWNTKFENSL